MAVKIQLRRDTTSNWDSNNPVLLLGEIGLDITSGNFKIGNGTSQWSQLNYFSTAVEDVISQQQLNDAIAAANIKSAYESNADTNAFTDAIKTKLETTGIVYTVADYTEADAIPNLIAGDLILVLDSGNGKWELNMFLSNDVRIMIASLSVLENAYEASSVKAAYEINADTNAFTDALQTKLNGIEENAKDDQDASEVAYTDTNQTYALGIHIQDAIYAIDDELISLDGRLDVVEGNDETVGSIAKALKDAQDYSDLVASDLNDLDTAFNNHTIDPNLHFTQAQISITESQISDLTTIFEDTALTGVPTATTATTGTNTTQIATTAFVQASLAAAQTIDGGEF